MLKAMRLPLLIVALQLSALSFAQAQAAHPIFEVASVRPSQHEVGPDYNNQITYSGDRFTGRNVTLKRLIAEALHCQINQVTGPAWIDRNEYDIEARLPTGTDHPQIALMLRTLLDARFQLKEHEESRDMRVYELTVARNGPKIQPVKAGAADRPAGQGFHFRGDMRQFADLLAVQFSIPAMNDPSVPSRAGGTLIPVLDKTGLQGTYDAIPRDAKKHESQRALRRLRWKELQFFGQVQQALPLGCQNFAISTLEVEVSRYLDQPIHNFVGGGGKLLHATFC